jgi:uncharacterized membrane protein
LGKFNRSVFLLAFSLIVIICSLSLGYIVSAQPPGVGNVHGTTIDENGDSLKNVRVRAYSSSGGIASTKYTDSDGYFRLALDKGTYTLMFEKEGYVKVEVGITVPAGWYTEPENDPVKMGEIILKRSLSLTASVISRYAAPGETVVFPFTVSNLGEEKEDLTFSINSSEGWDTRVLDSSGEIIRVQLDSGNLGLNLEVTVPEMPVETEIVSLTIMGSTNASLAFTIFPSETYKDDIKMSSTYPHVSEELGRTIVFPMTISNEGTTDETIDLVAVVPEGWTTRFITSNQMEILSLFLESGKLETLTIEVEPHEEASVGEYLIEINAVSEAGELRDFLDLKVNLKKVEGEVELLSAFTDVTAETGNVIEYPITIWNKGDNEDLFLITVLSAPADWDTVLKSEDIEISSLRISAGASTSLVFEVTIPSDYEPGSYKLILTVESKTVDMGDTLNLGVELREASSDVEIISTFTDVTVQAGNAIEYPLRIRNNGESDSQIRLSVASAPSNWDTKFTSDSVEVSSFLIDAGESLNIKLEVEPPDAVETGDYSITILAESDDGKTLKDIELKATVVGSYEIELELSTLYETTTIGNSVEFTAEIINQGNTPITTIYLETIIPNDWDITSTPSQISKLDPRESETFTLVVKTPADTVAGDYLITVKALSDQAESEETDLRITAKASTSWGLIGIGLAGVAVIGLVIAFTRFKRR